MDDLLTAKQVQEILKVDRITVYRMLKDGRLKGVKIGQQWRFSQQDVDHLLSGNGDQPAGQAPGNGFPTHCVQTIQELFADVSQMPALVVDAQGQPLTQASGACGLCQALQASESGRAMCQAAWRSFFEQSAAGGTRFTCPDGLAYTGAPILDRDEQIALFLVGPFQWQAPDPGEQAAHLERLAKTHGVSLARLKDAAAQLIVIRPEDRTSVEGWAFKAAHAVHSILHERVGFVARLQQIANLTQM